MSEAMSPAQSREESSAPGGALSAKPQVDFLKGLLVLATAIFVLFLFLQPVLSWLFNDVFGMVQALCETPAEEIQCGSGVSYVEIAERLDRRNANGTLIGCSCEDGFLRDYACAVGTSSFSISYFISTAPGTGAMAALSTGPMIGAWFYGAGTLRQLSHTEGSTVAKLDVLTGSLVAYQFFYGLFLINTVCIASTLHTISVVLFNMAAIVHYITVACTVDRSTRAGMYIIISVAVGVVAIGLGTLWPESPSWLGQHAFWLGECIGLTSGMSIAPILLFFGSGGPAKAPPIAPTEDPTDTAAAASV